MASINRMENSEVREFVSQKSDQDYRNEEKRKFYAEFVSAQVNFSKQGEELIFLRNLTFALLSPSFFPDQGDALILKCSGVFNDFKDRQRVLSENDEQSSEVISSHFDLMADLKETELAATRKMILNIDFSLSDIAEMVSLSIGSFAENKALDGVASLFSKLEVEDWTKIQESFGKNQIPFSEDFMKRCQQVALKAIAA